jgi:tape measure domain-containing protein
MADVSKTVDIIFRAVDNASAGIAGIEKSLSGISTSAGTAAPDLEKAARSAQSLGNASQPINELANAMTLLAGSLVFREFISANEAIQIFGRSMTLVTGSTAGAAEALQYVKSISNTLGLEVSGAASNFISLSAAARGTALEGEGTRDIFEAISKAMSLLGKSSAETNGALTAVQQIISKGTVSAEELRGQLGERLPGAFQIAARAVGVTTEELGNLLQSGKLVAEDFLPKFADELNRTFGDTTYVTTFNAELNRLINSLKDLAVAGGESGLFSAITQALVDLTKGAKATAVEIDVISGSFSALRAFLAGGGDDIDGFKQALLNVRVNADIASSAIGNYNESLAETERLSRNAQEASQNLFSGNQTEAETERLKRYESTAVSSITAVEDAYKLLGLNASKINADFVGGFETIVTSATATGRDIEAAFKVTIPKIDGADQLERVSATLATAATEGKITWEQWARMVDQASESFLKNTGYVKESASEIRKQTEDVKKQEEATARMALELEKLASNERIKAMEFRAEINVAQIEADTKRIEAAFESVNDVIGSTNDLMGDLFSILANPNLEWSQIRAIEDQINKENDIKKGQLELQRQLIEAQIRNLNAQTLQAERGDALIKIDGAGLQPHLEGFMWEILRTIQTRVNRDGLQFLLGV